MPPVLSYDDVRQAVLIAAEAAGLRAYSTRDTLETHTCDRECEILCVPLDEDPPFAVAAVVGFPWDAALTAESTYGDTCALYHEESDPCPHQDAEPDAVFDLDVRFTFNPPRPEDVPQVVTALQQIFRREIQHENLPEVQIQLSYLPDGRLVVQEAYAQCWWEISLNEEPLDLSDILEEARRILDAMRGSGLFPKRPPWSHDT